MRMCKCNVVQTDIFRRQNPVTRTLSVDLTTADSNQFKGDLEAILDLSSLF